MHRCRAPFLLHVTHKSLTFVQEGGDELEKLQAEAERILAEARAEAQKLIADARAAGLEASNSEVAKIKEVWPFIKAWQCVMWVLAYLI
jgi:F0F1-type ATP synthase membrane subunit b/b'